jgi:bacteriocin biosynthesis cyclodehydratase domain-containing protein
LSTPTRRPCLALPFTVLTAADTVRLVAGEDFRYTLTSPGLDAWLPAWLAQLDGRRTLDETLGAVPAERRADAARLAERLYGERVLIDGPPVVEPAGPFRITVAGSAAWREALVESGDVTDAAPLTVLCQDSLDYEEALRFNRERLDAGNPWLWATTGPLSRAYVSPLFLPDAGPCLGCLLNGFRCVSPAPELYDALADHTRAGRRVASSPFPVRALRVLHQLILWKASLAGRPESPPPLFRLHVLEAATMEVSTHRVFLDPECPECRGRA